jgi:hypothetical protein
MGFKHITAENIEGNDNPKLRWHTTETYKVTDEVAQQLADMKDKPTGGKLATWLQDHGGKLDDGNGKPGRMSVKNDGTILNDHYKNGEYQNADVVHPKGSKHDNTGAQALLAIMTGGASLFVTPFIDQDKDDGGSKFTGPATTQPDHAKPEEHKAAATTKKAPAAHTPKGG